MKYLPESHVLRSFAMLKVDVHQVPNRVPEAGTRQPGQRHHPHYHRPITIRIQAQYATAAGTRRQHFTSLPKLYGFDLRQNENRPLSNPTGAAVN